MSIRDTIASAITRSSTTTICEVCQQPIEHDDLRELSNGEPAHRDCIRGVQAAGRVTQQRRDRR